MSDTESTNASPDCKKITLKISKNKELIYAVRR